MKQTLILGILFLVVGVAFGQSSVKNDPTYSAGNYKHPNKAVYAKLHNLDGILQLKSAEVLTVDNYKTPYSKKRVERALIAREKTRIKFL